MFLGLNFSILGVLGVGKFGKNFFVCFFLVIQNNLKFVVVPMYMKASCVVLQIKYNQSCFLAVLIFNALNSMAGADLG